MTMSAKGLAKLLEELGELSQVAAKKLAYYETDEHPDGAGSLAMRMQEEMGDVQASIEFVALKFNLDLKAIEARKTLKLERFKRWDADKAENSCSAFSTTDKNAALTDAEAGAILRKTGVPNLIVAGEAIKPKHWFEYARAVEAHVRIKDSTTGTEEGT